MRKTPITLAIAVFCSSLGGRKPSFPCTGKNSPQPSSSRRFVTAIRAVKADEESWQLQNEFFEKAKHPLDTRP